MKIQFMGLLMIAVIGFSSCKKDDVSPPTITLELPTELTFTASVGDQITFKGTFSDRKELGKLEYTQDINAGPQTIFKTIEDFDDPKLYEIQETYTIDSSAVVGDVIRVGFIGYDVPGNNTISRVSITVE